MLGSLRTLVSMISFASKFVRFRILFTCSLITILASLSVGILSLQLLLVLLVLVAWYIHAASSNDYADRQIDAINLQGVKNRPLLSKNRSNRRLWIVHGFAGVAALMFAIPFGWLGVGLTFFILLMDYAYSFKPVRITDRGIISQLLLPLAYVLFPFSLGYWSTNSIDPYPWLLMAGLYFGFIARLFLKDFRDVKGDQKYGKRTYLIRHGAKSTCLASALSGTVALVVVAASTNFSRGVLIVLVLSHFAVLVLLYRLAQSPQIAFQMKLIAAIAKFANASIVVVIIFYLSQYFTNMSSLEVILPLLIGLFLLTGVTIKSTSSPSFFQRLIWLPIRLFMRMCCSVQIIGVENVKKVHGNAVFVSNHVTEIDPLMIVAALPFFSTKIPIAFVTSDTQTYRDNWSGWRKFLYGGNFFKIIGGYPAYKGLNNYEHALKNHLLASEKGMAVCIFPVGRRHADSDIGEARGGASFLIQSTSLPAIPVHIQGLNRQTSIGDYLKRRPKLVITFGAPVYSKEIFGTKKTYSRKDYEKASVQLMKKIIELN